MAKHAVAVLTAALRERKLDRTLTTALAASGGTGVAASHIAALDGGLQGGFPRGQLSEIAGPASSGRTTVLLSTMAGMTAAGELAALVDTCDRLDVDSAVTAGIALDRFLWVRGETAPVERMVDRALKSFTLILQAGGFGLAALDLADIPIAALKRLPLTTWLRVHRTIEGSDTACVLLVPEPLARSAGGVTLRLRGTTQWTGTSDRSRRLTGLGISGRLASPRHRVEGEMEIRGLRIDD